MNNPVAPSTRRSSSRQNKEILMNNPVAPSTRRSSSQQWQGIQEIRNNVIRTLSKMTTLMEKWDLLLDVMVDDALDDIMKSMSLRNNSGNKFRVWYAMVSIAYEMMCALSQSKDMHNQILLKLRKHNMWFKDVEDAKKYFRGEVNLRGNTPKNDRFFRLTIVGACSTAFYFVRTAKSQQMILLIGENHETYGGNTLDILKTLVDKLECPIDVMVERSYEPTTTKVSSQVETSLMTLFRREQWSECFRKGFVPKQTLISSNQSHEYFDKCVAPFKGKIKFWGIDLRQMSWFKWFRFDHIDSVDTSKLYQHGRDLFMDMLDYDAFRKNPSSYDKKVKEGYKTLFKELASTYNLGHDDKQKFQSRFVREQNIHEKDHMKLMRSLSYLRPEIAKYLCDKVRQNCKQSFESFGFVAHLPDIYTYLRIARLVREEKNRLIVLFGGAQHLVMMRDFLTHCPDFAYVSDPDGFLPPHVDIVSEEQFPCLFSPLSKEMKVLLKELPPSKTTRMQAYEKRKD